MKPHTLLLLGALIGTLPAAEDIVISDFEGADYGDWTATGDAFGGGPAHGALPGQQHVDGFSGKGFVNSFHHGDQGRGTLTSPTFTIERTYITFLIGGGGFPGMTCMNLLVDGHVVRTAVGPNTKEGGQETLEPASWEVKDLARKAAQIQIVDAATGGWGHINVDQIVQTDATPPEPPVVIERRLTITADYIQLPLMQRNGGKPLDSAETFSIQIDGKVVRYVHLQIASTDQKPDLLYSYDVHELRGRDVVLRFKSRDHGVLDRLALSDRVVIDPQAYDGPNRPRFHFSPRVGWMNDINGPYYQDGLYHIFFQHNPTTVAGSCGFDMHWGHSVSKDLVHWEEWPVALFPDASGQCYSGSAILLAQRIPGINDRGPLPTPAQFFTATGGGGQHLATSVDGGRTWVRFTGNPAAPVSNRDPKVFWHEASRHYVMVVYDEKTSDHPEGYQFLRSTNLTTWEKTSLVPGWAECPDLISMRSAVTGKEVWLLYGSGHGFASCYQLGDFDGRAFSPTSPERAANRGGNFYAAITFANAPTGRHIMMGWARDVSSPGEPFNQCASVPLELALKAIDGADTLFVEPVAELDTLRGTPLLHLANVSVAEANRKLQSLAKDAQLDVVLRIMPAAQDPVGIRIRGSRFSYKPAIHTVTGNGRDSVLHNDASVAVRCLIDRSLAECFWNGGEAAYTFRSIHTDPGPAFAIEGEATVEELTVYPMADIWKPGTR